MLMGSPAWGVYPGLGEIPDCHSGGNGEYGWSFKTTSELFEVSTRLEGASTQSPIGERLWHAASANCGPSSENLASMALFTDTPRGRSIGLPTGTTSSRGGPPEGP